MPKPSSAKWYRGASLLSLNRYEAGDVLGIAGGVSDSEAEGCATRLRDSLQVERVVITLGGSGMVAAGASASDAITRVRAVRHPTAVETDEQVAFVKAYERHVAAPR